MNETNIEYKIDKQGENWNHRLKSDYDSIEFLFPFSEKLSKKDHKTCLFCDKRRYENDSLICKNCRNSDESILKLSKDLTIYFTFLKIGARNNSKLRTVDFEKREIQKYGKLGLSNKEKINITLKKEGRDIASLKKKREIQKYGKLGLSRSEKAKQTNIERYGCSNVSGNEKIKNKKKETLKKNFGVENPTQSPKIQEKAKQTNLKKYGVSSPAKCSIVRNKTKRTNLKKYGSEYALSSKSVRNKIRETNLERYGGTSPTSSKEIIEKVRHTRFKKNHGMHIDEVKELFRNEAFKNNLASAYKKYPTITYNISRYFFTDEEKKTLFKQTQSYPEILIAEEFSFIEWETNVRSIVPYNNLLEIDLLNEEHKISIEFDGFYWHQIHNGGKLDKDLKKAEAMRSIGYKHLSLNESDLNHLHKIEYLINPNKKKIYAKNCDVLQIDNPKSFLDSYHIQGSVPSSVCYGLYFEDELIQVMTFGKSRFDKAIEWEILRLCSHPDYMMVGGAQRIFKRFLEENSCKSIVSYSDNKYFDGKVYEKLGFEFVGNTSPNYIWFKNGDIYKRYQTMKHKLPKILGEDFNPDLTEVQNMESNGWVKIEDLGNKKWLLKL